MEMGPVNQWPGWRPGLAALGLLTALLPVTADAHEGSHEEVESPTLTAHPRLAAIGPAPEFRLFDTSGTAVNLSDYRGRVVLLAFIFTTCTEVCPKISAQMSALQRQLRRAGVPGEKAFLLSVTVDPETDSKEVLAKYASNYDADPSCWLFLRDERKNLAKVLAAYDEWTRKVVAGNIDHPARVYLIDAQGRIREIYSLSFFDERQARLDILALLEEHH
jgi:protein SCO1